MYIARSRDPSTVLTVLDCLLLLLQSTTFFSVELFCDQSVPYTIYYKYASFYNFFFLHNTRTRSLKN